MFKKFTPHYRVSHFKEIDLNWLNQRNIEFLLVDLDNTLVARKIPGPTDELILWVKKITDSGIKLAIASNNRTEKRVQLFGNQLGIPYYLRCGKPSPKKLLKIINELEMDISKTALLGDQLSTDILGAHRTGIKSVLTSVRPGGDLIRTRILRWFERRLLFLIDNLFSRKKSF